MAAVPQEYQNDWEEQFYLALQERKDNTPNWFLRTKYPKPYQRKAGIDAYIYVESQKKKELIKVPFKVLDNEDAKRLYLSKVSSLISRNVSCVVIGSKSPREIRIAVYEVLRDIRDRGVVYDVFYHALFARHNARKKEK